MLRSQRQIVYDTEIKVKVEEESPVVAEPQNYTALSFQADLSVRMQQEESLRLMSLQAECANTQRLYFPRTPFSAASFTNGASKRMQQEESLRQMP